MAVVPLSHHFFSLNQCSGNFLLADENSTTIRVVCVLMCDRNVCFTRKHSLNKNYRLNSSNTKPKKKRSISSRSIYVYLCSQETLTSSRWDPKQMPCCGTVTYKGLPRLD